MYPYGWMDEMGLFVRGIVVCGGGVPVEIAITTTTTTTTTTLIGLFFSLLIAYSFLLSSMK